MDTLQKPISNLIRSQFPAFYNEEGELFIEFVKAYYEWMENKADFRDTKWINEKLSYITVQSGNSVIVGTNTFFTEHFANGDQIAILRETDKENYTFFTISTVSNNTFLTLTSNPDFSLPKTKYTTIKNVGNPIYYIRNYDEIKDIDATPNEFLVYFKEKYLKNLQFVNITETRKLVKNSLSLYRSKGTERSIELLFKLAFGITPRVYYPSSDLFKLSDGEWFIPRYIEVSLSERTVEFVNKEIVGLQSGATAFAESVIRRTVNGKFIDVIYVSSIRGTFISGESINTSDRLLLSVDCPKMVGSLTSVLLDASGVGSSFEVGDILTIESERGRQAKGRVTSTSNTSGLVTFTLENGGYGYNTSPTIMISDFVLTISESQFSNTTATQYFKYFDKIIQPIADINYNSANGDFLVYDSVFTYHPNNDVKGTGRVLTVEATNSTAGTIRISVLSGNMEATSIYTTSNAVGATLNLVNGYFDTTATGNVVGVADQYILTVNNATGSFIDGDTIYQYNPSNVVVAQGTLSGSLTTLAGTLQIEDTVGIFSNAYPITSSSNVQANLISIEMRVGVELIGANSFISTPNNYVYSPNSSVTGTISFVSSGSSANITISNTLLYPETVALNTDLIADYGTVALNAATFGFPGNTAANLTHATIDDALSFSNVTIGKLSAIISMNQGTDYNFAPFVRVVNPLIAKYKELDTFALTLSNVSSNFEIGELVTQSATGARGLVVSTTENGVVLERLNFRLANTFTTTSNSTTTIIGSSTGCTANVDIVTLSDQSNYLGENAMVGTSLDISTGAVSSVEIIDSGFGYLPGEELTLSKDGREINGIANVHTTGFSQGFYLRKGGFLSDDKKLFDGNYYQYYSYEVRSSKTLDKYLSMLKEVVHVAGTKVFGAFVHDTDARANIDVTTKVSVE
jgi:hypothetical protein